MTDPPTLLLSGREALVRNARDKACMSALARAIGGVRVVQGGILAAGRGGLHSIEGVPLLDVGVVDPVDPGDLHLRGVRSVREGARRIGVRPGFSALECIIRFGREADSEVSYMVGVGRQSTCSSGPRPGSIGRTAGCSRLVARKVSATEPVHCDSRLVASAVLVRVSRLPLVEPVGSVHAPTCATPVRFAVPKQNFASPDGGREELDLGQLEP